ncbi:MAG TPA: MFS transporter, partial [Microbacterium sp.]|nr:MFS transporter [Microbacterium sp.]
PRLASANTVSSVLSQLAQAGGIALGATVVRIVGGTGTGADGSAGAMDPMLPYPVAFAVAAALRILPRAGALRLDPRAGAHVSARPRR